jgi:hypothetical protein
MFFAGARRAPVFISAPDSLSGKRTAASMPGPRTHHRARGKGTLASVVRVSCRTFPSPELPTFNGLYPSIVTRRVSQ